MTILMVVALVGSELQPVAADDVEHRVAEFWKRVDALQPSDYLAAADLGQWARNVIAREPNAAISVGAFRDSTARMQVAFDRAAAGTSPRAPSSSDVEDRIARFWQRVNVLTPADFLTAADLGQWGLNVTDRDPSARIRVDDFRASTAVMQAAFDRARTATLINAFSGRPERLLVGANRGMDFPDYFGLGFDVDRAVADGRATGMTVIKVNMNRRTGVRGGDCCLVSWMGTDAKPRQATYAGLDPDREWWLQQYDRLLDLGARRGVRFIIVLADICCGTDSDRATRITTNPNANPTPEGRTAFKTWISQLLQRRNTVNGRIWRDDPTIFAWDLINEPEPRYNGRDQNGKDIVNAVVFPTCAALQEWVGDIGSYVKSLDKRHPTTVGFADDLCAEAAAVPQVDFVSFHWYIGPDANQGRSIGQLVTRFSALKKPVLISEFGRSPSKRPAILDDSYLAFYRANWDEAFCAGAMGVMFGMWGPVEARAERLSPDPSRYFPTPLPPTFLDPWPPFYFASIDHDTNDTKFIEFLRGYSPPVSC